jgi:hypothetical protein
MQDLNNEMDDLLRKAVELYPLKPCDSQWENLSTRIKSKKRWVLFLPLVFRQKNKRMPMFLGVMILIPAVFSLELLVNKKSATNKLPKEAIHLNKGFKLLRVQVSSSINYENTRHGKKYSAKEEPLSLYTNRRINDMTAPSRIEVLNDDDHRIPEVHPVYMGSPLLFHHQAERRTPVAEQKNFTLQHLTLPRRQGFYLGVLAGPLFSQVKNQGMTKPGFDFGLLIGYSFSKRLSLETGIMRTRQYFTAAGDYLQEILNMGGVKSLEGSRNAISIPLKLKYNVINGSSGNFFLTAGVSTFVGVDDHIVITVNYLPVPPSDKIDLGAPSYLPAYFNFSLGYEYKIGKFSDIRIEPYLEIPTNSSAGNSFKTHAPDHYVHVFNSGIHIAISQFVH